MPTPPAIDLIDESCVYVKAPMDEIDAPKIRDGQFVRITLDALPGKSFTGKVRRIAPYVAAVEKQARTVDIEATFDDPAEAGRLLVGYSADVEVVLDARQNVLRVPTSALLEGGRVLVVDADDRLVERKLKTGLANWEYTEVVEGLAQGDRVVTSLDRVGVKAGASVTVEDQARAGSRRRARRADELHTDRADRTRRHRTRVPPRRQRGARAARARPAHRCRANTSP